MGSPTTTGAPWSSKRRAVWMDAAEGGLRLDETMGHPKSLKLCAGWLDLVVMFLLEG